MSSSKFRLTHSPKVSPDVARLIPDKIFELTAWATGRCDLRCRYCFIFKLYPQQPSSDMQPDVVEALIDFGLRYGSRPIRIWWFGGEPLLAFDNVIKYAVDLVLKRGLRVGLNGDVHFGLTTNCTLLTEDKVKFFARYGFGILLSIDGTKEKHDKYRVFPDGRGSFDVAWRGLQLVRKYLNPNPSIRWTVAPETVEGLANDVKWYVDQGLTNLAIDWVYEVKWYEEDLKKLRQEMYKIREYMIEWMRQGIPVMLKFVRDGVAPAVAPFRAWWKSRCGLGQGSVGVDVDGTIYSCHRFVSTHKKELAIGHVKEGWYWDRRYGWVADWIKHPPYSEDGLERCRYCPYRVACHGGCLAVNYDLFGDIHIVPRSYCDIMQVLSEVWLPFHYLMMRENNSTYRSIYFGGRR